VTKGKTNVIVQRPLNQILKGTKYQLFTHTSLPTYSEEHQQSLWETKQIKGMK
jgi:hypothetical protein